MPNHSSESPHVVHGLHKIGNLFVVVLLCTFGLVECARPRDMPTYYNILKFGKRPVQASIKIYEHEKQEMHFISRVDGVLNKGESKRMASLIENPIEDPQAMRTTRSLHEVPSGPDPISNRISSSNSSNHFEGSRSPPIEKGFKISQP
ncbi:hypothetical protein GOP47_0002896 [Adiantum capillus-veneris]|uniref:Uncharacterized protein n=1 Tax=Adiantum capillus-veneris TaxID=13818 RepID=A0A9D4ZPK5_ADICA|nr:hypothetical protein GOP47_0002896 [Adiantum capillus-veneris]